MSQLDCNQPFVHKFINNSNLHNFLCEYVMDMVLSLECFLLCPL